VVLTLARSLHDARRSFTHTSGHTTAALRNPNGGVKVFETAIRLVLHFSVCWLLIIYDLQLTTYHLPLKAYHLQLLQRHKNLLNTIMKAWWIGCSGFSYKHWRGGFYPTDLPSRRWFEFYFQHFNTVEINATFYRYPKLKTLQDWYDRSPDDFKFTVKVPRFVTHFRKFVNANRQLGDFYELVDKGLGSKLGTILFQLPSNYAYTNEHLDRLLDALDPSFNNVIEFRDGSWWNNTVYKILKNQNITFCGISHPALPEDIIKTTPVVYYRFHGVPQLYKSPYSKKELQHVADEIKKFRGVTDVYIYFNNDIDVSAIYNAREFQSMTLPKKQLRELTLE
jgi:uncharacterized protein YecE (DUF72 family)